MSTHHHRIVIVGGGNAGLSVAAQLLRKDRSLDIAILDPAEQHYYQPAWTLVGGGDFDVRDTVRPQKDVMPEGVTWIREAVETFQPEEKTVTTTSGSSVGYDLLVACPGIQLNWDAIPGLTDTLGRNGVCSNYGFDLAPYTHECIRKFEGGTALFTQPGTPIKCGGAPQKIMYLAADNFRRRSLGDAASIEFCTAGGVIFGVEKYARRLLEVCERYGIELRFLHNLVAIDGPGKTATFEVTDTATGEKTGVTKSFDMIHVCPPQSAPDFVRESPLAGEAGWIDVDKATLQHSRFPDVFALGDATNTPNAKTGAAIRKQAPVLVANLLSHLRSEPLTATYGGYGSCPLVTGYGRLILAEFDYANEPAETFPFDQSKERWSMYQLKKRVLPWLYWNKILKGTA